jgi:hypothetical protein
MPLTITEATAVNTLLEYLLGIPGERPPYTAAAFQAGELLVKNAHAKLWAGITVEKYRQAWNVRFGEVLDLKCAKCGCNLVEAFAKETKKKPKRKS